VERESDGARWRGDFSKTYVEEVSAKTGSFKKFAVFAKMLVAAVVNESSESVSVDLLTYADLERLKRERTSRPGSARDTTGVRASAGNARDVSPASQKRYLILTHADEFDRTHYPLPLVFEDDPSPQALQATVERLRRENRRLKEAFSAERAGDHENDGVGRETGSVVAENATSALRDENAELRVKVECLERRLVAGGDTTLLESLPPAYAQVERLQAEVKALTRDAVDAKRALDHAERERRGLETALAGAESSKRRLLAKKQRELEDAREDIARRRDVERELRTKVRDLEAQCDGLERRLRAAGGGYAPPPRAASRPASRAASAERSRPWREGPAFGRANAANAASASPRAYGRDDTNTNDTRGFRTPTRFRSPSPARERAPSRGRDRAPRSPRFDPTAYVAEKRAREEARFRNSARGMASGASSPYGSRAASPSPRARGGSAAASPRGAGGHKDAKTRRAPTTRSPSPAPRDPRGGGAAPARVGVGGGARARARGAGRGGNAASSPGRVLRDVQRRLTEVAAGEKAAAAKPRARSGSRVTAAKENAPADASAEIADIDSRLAALQTFLREAKSAGSPAGKEGRAAAA
jgi:coiled-coil domain-containing protein 61